VKKSLTVLGMLAFLWSAPLLAAQYALQVNGLACPFCAYGIEKKLRAIDGVEDIEFRLGDGEVDVSTAKTVTPGQINSAIERAGFGLRELRLRGTGDVTTVGSPALEFSPELSLPLVRFEGPRGRYAVEGVVVQRGDRWVLKVTRSREAK